MTAVECAGGQVHLFKDHMCVRCNVSLADWIDSLDIPNSAQPMLPFDDWPEDE